MRSKEAERRGKWLMDKCIGTRRTRAEQLKNWELGEKLGLIGFIGIRQISMCREKRMSVEKETFS